MTRAIFLLLLAAQAGWAAPPVTYTVRADVAHERLDVSVCVANAAERRRFVPGDEHASQLLGEVRRSSGGGVQRSDEVLVAQGWRAGECLAYPIDLRKNASEGRRALVRRVGPDWTLDPGLMLWRPENLQTDADAELVFELPEGWAVSAPWKALDDSAPHRRFKLGTISPEYPSWVALGPLEETSIGAGAGRFRLALLGSMDEAQRAKVTAHIRDSALEVSNTFPRAFALAPQVLVLPVGPAREASPFGMSNRGGAYAVTGLVDPTKSEAEYRDSWTFVHEFTHGVHPHLGDGRWISEGIATYYQNVLRARSGRLTEAEAWDELDAGFERGRRDRSELDLEDLSARMGRLGHYMRGYWSGTALVMMADVELRTRAKDPSSLDAALNAYLACCRAREDEAEPDAFLATLDRQVGGEVFSTLYKKLATQSDMPDLAETYRKLGLKHATPKVSIDEGDREAVALRHAIMAPGARPKPGP